MDTVGVYVLARFHMIMCLWTWGLFSNIKSVSMIFTHAEDLLCFILARILESYVLFWSPYYKIQMYRKWSTEEQQNSNMIDGGSDRRKVKGIRIVLSLKGKMILALKIGLFFFP